MREGFALMFANLAFIALALGITAGAAKLSFDSIVQRDAPDANRGPGNGFPCDPRDLRNGPEADRGEEVGEVEVDHHVATAVAKGVRPMVRETTLRFAPWSSSIWMASTKPVWEARCRADSPPPRGLIC